MARPRRPRSTTRCRRRRSWPSYGVTANMVHPPVTDTGWVTDAVRALVDQATTLFHVASP